MENKLDQEGMRQLNRKLVIQELFNEPKTSRSEIADKISLHKSTISTIYRELESEHLIEELGEGEVSKVGGRKPQLIRFNREYGFVVSFDVGRNHLRYLVARLTGEILDRGKMDLTSKTSYEDLKRAMLQRVLQLGDQGTINGLVGIAVGIHGVVHENRVVYTPFTRVLLEHDLGHELEIALDVPVFLENEANLAALYVRDFREHDREIRQTDFAVVNIHNGVGAGIVQNGNLIHGLNGTAGEIGRTIIYDDQRWQAAGYKLPVHFEELYSEDAILKRAGNLKSRAIARNELVELYQQHDPEIMELLQEWVKATTILLFNLAQYSAISTFYVHARMIARMPELFDEMQKMYHELKSESATQLKYAGDSVYSATLIGGIALTTRNILGLEDYRLRFTISQVDDTSWD